MGGETCNCTFRRAATARPAARPPTLYARAMPHAQLGGVDLHYVQHGSGDDVLLLCGLGDDHTAWDAQVRSFADRYRLTVVDNRGVGQSSLPDGPFGVADMAGDAAALLDHLGIGRAHVAGFSMGGAIAQELALGYPEKVRSLVLNGTYCRGDHFFREVIRSWQWAARKSDNLRDFLNVVNLWCFSPRIYNEGIMEEWLTEAAASEHAQSVDAFVRSADALIEHDSADRVGAIDVPTLVTVGELDLCLPERFSRELVERIPCARLRVIEANGHQPFQESPEAYNAILAEFWAST